MAGRIFFRIVARIARKKQNLLFSSAVLEALALIVGEQVELIMAC
jgi:hypothetical protein